MYVSELIVSYRLQRIPASLDMAQAMIAPAQAAAVLCPLLQHEPVEVAVLLCLNAKLELLAYHSLSRGTLDHSIVHARDVYRTALLANAAAVILGHNHPSGHLEPSPDDRSLTQALAAAGTLLGIELRDHIIVTPDGRWLSFNQLALL